MRTTVRGGAYDSAKQWPAAFETRVLLKKKTVEFIVWNNEWWFKFEFPYGSSCTFLGSGTGVWFRALAVPSQTVKKDPQALFVDVLYWFILIVISLKDCFCRVMSKHGEVPISLEIENHESFSRRWKFGVPLQMNPRNIHSSPVYPIISPSSQQFSCFKPYPKKISHDILSHDRYNKYIYIYIWRFRK